MVQRPWQRELYRKLRRSKRRGRDDAAYGKAETGMIPPLLITLAVGGFLFLFLVWLMELKLQPILAEAARTQTQNTITRVLEESLPADLAESGIRYEDLVTIQRDHNGNITALTTNMLAMNQLRARLVSEVLELLGKINVSDVSVPLGSLLNSGFLWAHGPSFQVRSLSVGIVTADFKSEFIAAGVNQTLHRIWMNVSVPMTILLPGGPVQAPVESRFCLAETVIVGLVPNTYLNLNK